MQNIITVIESLPFSAEPPGMTLNGACYQVTEI